MAQKNLLGRIWKGYYGKKSQESDHFVINKPRCWDAYSGIVVAKSLFVVEILSQWIEPVLYVTIIYIFSLLMVAGH